MSDKFEGITGVVSQFTEEIMALRSENEKLRVASFVRIVEILEETDELRADIRRLRAENEMLRSALAPFAAFAPTAEKFVETRAIAANDVSAMMPTKHFRLADFQAAARALAETKGEANGK